MSDLENKNENYEEGIDMVGKLLRKIAELKAERADLQDYCDGKEVDFLVPPVKNSAKDRIAEIDQQIKESLAELQSVLMNYFGLCIQTKGEVEEFRKLFERLLGRGNESQSEGRGER